MLCERCGTEFKNKDMFYLYEGKYYCHLQCLIEALPFETGIIGNE